MPTTYEETQIGGIIVEDFSAGADNTNLYIGGGEVRSPDFATSTGNFPVLAEDGAARCTLHVTGDFAVTAGSTGVDPDVATEGVDIQSL